MREQLTDSIWITSVVEASKVVDSVRRPFFYDISFEVKLPDNNKLSITKTVDRQALGSRRLLNESEGENKAIALLLRDLHQRGKDPRQGKIFSELADACLPQCKKARRLVTKSIVSTNPRSSS